MIKTIVIDDELKARETLKSLVNIYTPFLDIVAFGDCVNSGIEIIKKHQPELVFLDIEMPTGNGFQLLEQIDEINFETIFTTAHSSHAIKAIKYNALDYILKPIDSDELKEAVAKAEERIKKKKTERQGQKDQPLVNAAPVQGKLAIPTLEGLSFIDTGEIVSCIAEANYTRICLENGQKIMVSKTLKEFEGLLAHHNFYRVHNSSIVNISCISKYFKGEGGYIELSDGTTLEVSRRRKQGLLEKFTTIGKY